MLKDKAAGKLETAGRTKSRGCTSVTLLKAVAFAMIVARDPDDTAAVRSLVMLENNAEALVEVGESTETLMV